MKGAAPRGEVQARMERQQPVAGSAPQSAELGGNKKQPHSGRLGLRQTPGLSAKNPAFQGGV